MESGDEIAWQAKYVFDIDNTLKEASSSFTTVLKGHSRMVEFILSIPFDLPDPTYNRNGKPIKSAKKKWDDKVVAWKTHRTFIRMKQNGERMFCIGINDS
ncbi:hypothetical protein [Clostridium transplantifaecale]|uniref:hypothetical protein n=1 Tax=Clostridium transplantifaecale TaxID=2479838 RepID=UPI000F641B9E|nr:hypothetical protein [Clostridium transplantifaecale]